MQNLKSVSGVSNFFKEHLCYWEKKGAGEHGVMIK